MLSSDRTKSGGGIRMKAPVTARAYPTDPERMVTFAQAARKQLIACWSPGDRMSKGALEFALATCDFMEDCGRQGVVLLLPADNGVAPKPRTIRRRTVTDS
jgi:hypothetical protein